MSTTYELGSSSATAVTLYPEYDYKGGKRKIESERRMRDGSLQVYKWGDYQRIAFSANWVPAADAALVNSWWDTNTKLLFFVTSGSATEVNSVMLRGRDTPLAKYNKPYNDYCKGKILLEGY